MKNRILSAIAAMFVCACIALGCVQDSSARAELETSASPNIVFILMDDANLETYEKAMPKTQRLIADKGITFPNATYSMSQCCPSRASIQRGQYPHNTHVFTNRAPTGGWQAFKARGEQKDTYATDLPARYRTIFVGKYMNGYGSAIGSRSCYVPPGWDYWWAVDKLGGSAFCLNRSAHHSKKFKSELLDPIVFERGISEMDRAIDEGVPFFVALNVHAPHIPAEHPKRYNRRFTNYHLSSPSINEKDMTDKPSFMQDLPKAGPVLRSRMDATARERLRSAAFVDDSIERIVNRLRERGVLKNTYIVFYSDNGYHIGEHRMTGTRDMGAKLTPYIEDIRFPLIVRGPGITKGSTSEAMVQNVDLRSTFNKMAGVSPPAYVDGTSFLAEARGQGNFPRSYAYAEAPIMSGGPSWMRPWKAVYTPNKAFHFWANREDEFYDLRTDPYELDSSGEPPARMRKALDQFESCSGRGCVIRP